MVSLVERTDHMESEMIASALDRFHWNKTKAITSASSAPPFNTKSKIRIEVRVFPPPHTSHHRFLFAPARLGLLRCPHPRQRKRCPDQFLPAMRFTRPMMSHLKYANLLTHTDICFNMEGLVFHNRVPVRARLTRELGHSCQICASWALAQRRRFRQRRENIAHARRFRRLP